MIVLLLAAVLHWPWWCDTCTYSPGPPYDHPPSAFMTEWPDGARLYYDGLTTFTWEPAP